MDLCIICSGAVWSVCASADGSRLYSGSDDNTLRVWDALSGECLMVAFADRDGNSLGLDLKEQKVTSVKGEGWKYGGWRYRDEDGRVQMLPLEYFEDGLAPEMRGKG